MPKTTYAYTVTVIGEELGHSIRTEHTIRAQSVAAARLEVARLYRHRTHRIERIATAQPEPTVIHYYDASSETLRTIAAIRVRSMAGHVAGPEYRVSYQLADGSWINGVRHSDRGDLMTDVHVGTPWVR